jgi:4-hydroxy-tetrahydrodipicolinate synthase
MNQTDLMYFAGDDANALPTLAIGGTGLIGVTANIAPRPYRMMVDAVNAGNLPAPPRSTNCWNLWFVPP